MLLKKPADWYRYGSRQVGVPNQFSSRSHLVKNSVYERLTKSTTSEAIAPERKPLPSRGKLATFIGPAT